MILANKVWSIEIVSILYIKLGSNKRWTKSRKKSDSSMEHGGILDKNMHNIQWIHSLVLIKYIPILTKTCMSRQFYIRTNPYNVSIYSYNYGLFMFSLGSIGFVPSLFLNSIFVEESLLPRLEKPSHLNV